MTILKAQVFGGSLVGVFFKASNSYVLYPSTLLQSKLEEFKKVFKETPFLPLTINNSPLLGVYTASNEHGIIVPKLIKDNELELLKANIGDKIQIEILESIDNAYGNLILCNNKVAIISSLLKDYQKKVEDVLNTETIIYEFASSYLPGSISIANNNGCLVHPLATDEEIEYLADFMKIEVDVSTVNRGVPYLSAGAVINDKHGIFGTECTGPEMMRLTNVLKL